MQNDTSETRRTHVRIFRTAKITCLAPLPVIGARHVIFLCAAQKQALLCIDPAGMFKTLYYFMISS
jgi:hypothetical protein